MNHHCNVHVARFDETYGGVSALGEQGRYLLCDAFVNFVLSNCEIAGFRYLAQQSEFATSVQGQRKRKTVKIEERENFQSCI